MPDGFRLASIQHCESGQRRSRRMYLRILRIRGSQLATLQPGGTWWDVVSNTYSFADAF
jgi:hypothetical protein